MLYKLKQQLQSIKDCPECDLGLTHVVEGGVCDLTRARQLGVLWGMA
jgi:hypothetical protein